MQQALTARFGDDLARHRIVAILRGITPATVGEVSRTLHRAGVRFLEVTLNSPEPFVSIRDCAKEFAGTDLHVGAGTVLTPEQVDRVAEAGGTYIISPNANPAVIRRTKELGLVSIPGFLTPTEGFAALDAGADFLKCFPAGDFGPGYVKALKAVLPAPVLAVGGVGTDNLPAFLAVCAGAGIGSSLYAPGKPAEAIERDARALVAIVAGAR